MSKEKVNDKEKNKDPNKNNSERYHRFEQIRFQIVAANGPAFTLLEGGGVGPARLRMLLGFVCLKLG